MDAYTIIVAITSSVEWWWWLEKGAMAELKEFSIRNHRNLLRNLSDNKHCTLPKSGYR